MAAETELGYERFMPGAAPEKRMGEEVELSGRAQKCHVDLMEFPIDQVKQ